MAKKENEKETEQKEKKFSLKKFFERYKNDLKFRAIVKLSIYFIFFFIILVLGAVTSNMTTNESSTVSDNTKTTTTASETTKTTSYREILNELKVNSANVKLTVDGENKYIIEEEYDGTVINGTLETPTETLKYSIKDSETYEVKMGEETLNNDLLNNYDITFINYPKLIDILTSYSAIKQNKEEYILYSYSDITVSEYTYNEIIINVENNHITNITAKTEKSTYNMEISYKLTN